MAYDPEETDEAAALEDVIGRLEYLKAAYPSMSQDTVAQLASAITNHKAAALIIDAIDLLTAATGDQ
jgi:hypothetical protein